MAIRHDRDEYSRAAFWTTGITLFVFWNVGTLVGALAGPVIGDPETYGLDAAIPAAFVALLWPQLADLASRLTAVLAVGLTVILVPVVPIGIPVLAAGLVAVAVALIERPDGSLAWRRTGRRCTVIWGAIIVACLGCYLFKLAGLSVPGEVLERPLLRRISVLLPVALLAALVATGTRQPRGPCGARRSALEDHAIEDCSARRSWSSWRPQNRPNRGSRGCGSADRGVGIGLSQR